MAHLSDDEMSKKTGITPAGLRQLQTKKFITATLVKKNGGGFRRTWSIDDVQKCKVVFALNHEVGISVAVAADLYSSILWNGNAWTVRAGRLSISGEV